MKLDRLVSVIVVVAGGLAAQGATPAWPGFRGQNSSGVSADATPPIEISPSNSVLWKVPVPWSPSSPCIWKDKIFLTTYSEGELQTRCYRRPDGQEAWRMGVKPERLEAFHQTENNPAAPTPATDGRRLVSYFGSFGLICYDLKGRELWRHPLPVALSTGGYGTGASPLLAGNLVVVNRDQDEGSELLAVDLRTGKTAWETARPEAYGSFGTPILWRNNGVEEVITPGSLRLKGYALATGLEDWVLQGTVAFACTTPVLGDGRLFFAGWSPGQADAPLPPWEKFLGQFDKNKEGVIHLDKVDPAARDFLRSLDLNHDGKIEQSEYVQVLATFAKGENSLVAIEPGGRGDVTKSHVAWKFTRGLPHVASLLFYEGRVYMVENGGMLTSLEAKTGRACYTKERLGAPGNYYSSPVAAAGRIYLASLAGKLTVVKAGGEKPEILHQAEFGERILATPALVGSNLYLRTQSTLYAFGPPANR